MVSVEIQRWWWADDAETDEDTDIYQHDVDNIDIFFHRQMELKTPHWNDHSCMPFFESN